MLIENDVQAYSKPHNHYFHWVRSCKDVSIYGYASRSSTVNMLKLATGKGYVWAFYLCSVECPLKDWRIICQLIGGADKNGRNSPVDQA
ncbi:hypothetical protein M514_01098 [Trichuris suis]|uniref:Uncharacterized protein n=1 Tax=Trichuris suis TaxID=68888 RepID=A0A085MZD5_9BILA|nr:hypothetical protein M513_01098 [Trichuris suis]KFD62581.1 hypothetical protein M514_01098 [Trichuris suis]